MCFLDDFGGVLFYLLSCHFCQPQRHCSNAAHPHPCISTIGNIQDAFCFVALLPEVHSRQAAIRKETLHCFQVTLLVFSDVCSDSTYARHLQLFPPLMTILASSHLQLFPPLMTMLASSHLQLFPPLMTMLASSHLQLFPPLMTMLASSHLQLFPPLMTMLASSQSQSEWAFPPEQTTTTSIHQSSYADSLTLKAFTRSASGKEWSRYIETGLTATVWYGGPKKLKNSGWSSDVWSQPTHWAQTGRGQTGLKNPTWLKGFSMLIPMMSMKMTYWWNVESRDRYLSWSCMLKMHQKFVTQNDFSMMKCKTYRAVFHPVLCKTNPMQHKPDGWITTMTIWSELPCQG